MAVKSVEIKKWIFLLGKTISEKSGWKPTRQQIWATGTGGYALTLKKHHINKQGDCGEIQLWYDRYITGNDYRVFYAIYLSYFRQKKRLIADKHKTEIQGKWGTSKEINNNRKMKGKVWSVLCDEDKNKVLNSKERPFIEIYKSDGAFFFGKYLLDSNPHKSIKSIDKLATKLAKWNREVFSESYGNNAGKNRVNDAYEARERKALSLSLPELKRRAFKAESRIPASKDVQTTQNERNPDIAAYVKKLAAGICHLCNQSAPFKKRNQPYLEVHHIKWISKGGGDTVKNTVALCPNCHRKMHVLGLKRDVKKLADMARKRKK